MTRRKAVQAGIKAVLKELSTTSSKAMDPKLLEELRYLTVLLEEPSQLSRLLLEVSKLREEVKAMRSTVDLVEAEHGNTFRPT